MKEVIATVTAGISANKEQGHIVPNSVGMSRILVFIEAMTESPNAIGVIWGGYLDHNGVPIAQIYRDYVTHFVPQLRDRTIIVVGVHECSVDNIPAVHKDLRSLLSVRTSEIKLKIVTDPNHFSWLRKPWEMYGYQNISLLNAGEVGLVGKLQHYFLYWLTVTRDDPFWINTVEAKLARAFIAADAKKFLALCRKLSG